MVGPAFGGWINRLRGNRGANVIRYKCPKCASTLESDSAMAGQKDQCPLCRHVSLVPLPKKTKRRGLWALVGTGGVVIAGVLVFLLLRGVGSGTPPPRSEVSSGHAPTTLPAGDQAAPLTPEQLFERASPAVVYIVVRDKDFKPLGLGSGFFVDANGLIVTNYHVIKGAEFATVRLSSGATLFVDGVAATDPNCDLALLKVSGGSPAFLKTSVEVRVVGEGEPIRPDDLLRDVQFLDPLPKVGSTVYAIGNPQGLENTFSAGMVSGHRKMKEGLTAIQVTAPISPGSSGGPLLNVVGEVVGVTTSFLPGGQNLNFAVPVSAVQRLLQRQGKVETLASAGGGRFAKEETEELDNALAAIATRDWRGATEILVRLRKSQPDNPLVWTALGYLHGNLDSHEIAIQHYKHAITLKPDYAEAYLYTSFCYFHLHLYDEAIAACQQAITLNPGYVRAYLHLGMTYNRMGNDYELKALLSGAAKGQQEAVADYEKAVTALKQAIALDPTFALAFGQLADAYDRLGRHAEAVEACKVALTIDPNDAAAYSRLGSAYRHQNKLPEAIEAYKKAVSLDPNDRYAYMFLGFIYLETNRDAEAVEAYKKAVELDPTEPDAYFYMGACLKDLSKHSEAVESFKKAISLGIKRDLAPAVYSNMGRCYESLGQQSAAILAYRESLRLRPTGISADWAREGLRRLGGS